MGIKNMFKKSSKLFDKEGFYVVLFVCLCIVAVAAVYISRNNADTVKKMTADNTTQIEQKQPSNAEQVKEDVKSNNPTVPTMQPQNSTNTSSTSTVNKEVDKQAKKSDSSTEASSKAVVANLAMPAEGETVKKYDKENLQESKTMQQWETHEGIDIAADLGTEVKAAQNGKVVSVSKDDAILQNYKSGFGVTVTIDHGNGLRSVYSNLDNDVKVKEGDTVKKGQTIGVVGDTSVREAVSIEGSHLHFAVLKKSGKEYVTVNPLEYIKK